MSSLISPTINTTVPVIQQPVVQQAPAAVPPVAGTQGIFDSISDNFSGLGGKIMTGLFGSGKQNGQMMAYTDKSGARSFGMKSQMGGLQGGVPVSSLDAKNLSGAELQSYQTALGSMNSGTEQNGLVGKMFSPEGALAGMQMYAGIKQMNREDEKWEIMKRDKEESDKRAKERRKGRLALGDTLGTIGR